MHSSNWTWKAFHTYSMSWPRLFFPPLGPPPLVLSEDKKIQEKRELKVIVDMWKLTTAKPASAESELPCLKRKPDCWGLCCFAALRWPWSYECYNKDVTGPTRCASIYRPEGGWLAKFWGHAPKLFVILPDNFSVFSNYILFAVWYLGILFFLLEIGSCWAVTHQ